MKKSLLLLMTVALGMTAAASGFPSDKEMPGTIVSENSVACGTQEKGKKKTVEEMCQEYVIRTDTTEYHVRQEKEAHKAILPMNAPVELTLNKDKMKFKVDGKGYEMLIVSESAIPASGAAPVPKP
jgi:hypothetical protein